MLTNLEELKANTVALFAKVKASIATKLDKTANAVSATKLLNPFNFSITTDATGSASVPGNSNVVLQLTLANTGVTPGAFGSASQVPVLTVDSKGRIVSIATATIPATPTASLTQAGIVQLNSSTTSVSETQAATPKAVNAVKAALDTTNSNLAGVKITADAAIPFAQKGVANGVATLDATGKIPAIQLPDNIGSGSGLKKIVSGPFDLAAGASQTFALKTLLSATVDAWDTLIDLKVKDPVSTSPTYNKFINSEAVATVSVDVDNLVVTNNYNTALTFRLTVAG